MTPRIASEDGVWFIERTYSDDISALEFWDGQQWVRYKSAALQFPSEREAEAELELLSAEIFRDPPPAKH